MATDTSALKMAAWSGFSETELREIYRKKIANVKRAWQEFEERKLIIDASPIKAIVELTQNCNFRCIMCPQSWEEKFKKYRPDYNLPMDIFTKIADELFPGAIHIDLRGFGETTILPHWPEVVDYLERFPFIEWHLVTNLSLPREDTWEKMMRLNFSLGFSCDGATKETFESIRTRSHFDRIRSNMGVIQRAIKKHNSGWLYFISTIQKKNIHELKKIIELAREFDFTEVQFKVVQIGGHDQNLQHVPAEIIQKNVEEALDAAIDLNIRATFNDWLFTKNVDPMKVEKAGAYRDRLTPHAFPPSPPFDPSYWEEQGIPEIMDNIWTSPQVSLNKRCFKPYSFTYINYDAKMGTCNHMMYPDMLVMGDIRKQTVMEVWNCPEYQDFRQQLITALPRDKRCQWCFKHRMDD